MLIENQKIYKGSDVENIFFRPEFSGEPAEKLGVRVLFNMPVPTTVQVWSRPASVLQTFEAGWTGGTDAARTSKTIEMAKVKAETAFSASDYLSLVYERLASSGNVNMADISGTELEHAETELLRSAIAEGIRATMWIGDTAGTISTMKTFDGFLKEIKAGVSASTIKKSAATIASGKYADTLFDAAWTQAEADLKAVASEGNLVYFVSSDVLRSYQTLLNTKSGDAAYRDAMNGRENLCYNGIPVVEVPLGQYAASMTYGTSFCILTDRRNFVLALNTADMPGNEVRMWYNPDEMENRQRAVFLAGTAILDHKLVSVCINN